jgi:hypothetical protein
MFVAGAVALQAGCAPKAPPPAPPPPPLPPHLGPPPAATCVVAPFTVADGGTANVSMTLTNDGGYCAATLTAGSGRPYDAPLETLPPQHGAAHVVKYNGRTSVEYVPEPGFAGHDSFTVRLIVRGMPGYTTLQVAVTVAPPAAAAPKA